MRTKEQKHLYQNLKQKTRELRGKLMISTRSASEYRSIGLELVDIIDLFITTIIEALEIDDE